MAEMLGFCPVISRSGPEHRPIAKWAQHAGKPDSLTVLSEVTESTIIDTIEESGRRAQFVIIDLEGSASLMVCLAISRADLVIIPTQGSPLGATETARTVRLVKIQEIAALQNPGSDSVYPHQRRDAAAQDGSAS